MYSHLGSKKMTNQPNILNIGVPQYYSEWKMGFFLLQTYYLSRNIFLVITQKNWKNNSPEKMPFEDSENCSWLLIVYFVQHVIFNNLVYLYSYYIKR